MIVIKKDFPLRELNTFHFDVKASEYVQLHDVNDCKEWALSNRGDSDVLVMGEGSNLLFTGDFKGVILSPVMDFIKVLHQYEDEVLIEAGAGKKWDDFVEFCVSNSYHGVENLSLIPGTVGASPVQNIGAYGVEVKDVTERVNGIFIDTGEEFGFGNAECDFDYRSSVFKKGLKGKVIITSVVYRLSKKENFKLHYGHLGEKVKEYGEINIENIRKAVVSIRRSKLPDTDKTGNAGSFFKNPSVSSVHFEELQKKFPDIPGYRLSSGFVKVPAGWLIDKAGWKGKVMGKAGVHPRQALVLVNTGGATGKDILALASAIEKDIFDKYRITLEKEVNVV